MAVSGSGQIVIIKRDGSEGSSYPLISGCLSIGSAKDCNIRITTKGFPEKQCIITVNSSEARIKNLSKDIPTILNGKAVQSKVLCEGDIISFNNSKFKWEYTKNLSKRFSRKSVPSFPVKRIWKSFNKRKSESHVKNPDSQLKNQFEIKTRNSLGNLPGSAAPKTRQIAIVMPQRRNTEQPKKNMPADQRNRTKSENFSNNGRSSSKRSVNNHTYLKDAGILASGSKFRNSRKIEKLEDPVNLDKNKKAVLMLLSRSPNNRNIFKPAVNTSPINTPVIKAVVNNSTPAVSRSSRKFNSVLTKTFKYNSESNHNGISSESKLPLNRSHSRIPIKATRKSIKPIISTPAKISKLKNSDSKNVSFNPQLDYSNVDTIFEETKKSPNFKIKSRTSKIGSPGRYAILSGKKLRKSPLNNTNSSKSDFSKSLFDVSGVEAIIDGGSFTLQNNLSKTRSGKSPESKIKNAILNTPAKLVKISPSTRSARNTPNHINNSGKKSLCNDITSPGSISNYSRRSVNTSNGITNSSFIQNISGDYIEQYIPLITSTLKKRESLQKSQQSTKPSPKTPFNRLNDENYTNGNHSAVKSFISTLTNALNVVNNSGTDLESVVKTPEYRALSNQIISIGKFVDLSAIESPSPVLLEIGGTNHSTRATRSSLATPTDSNQKKNKRNTVTPPNPINSSPIISPKHRTDLNQESPDTEYNMTDIISTPNLSKLFEVEASTPMDYRKSSVVEKIRHFEAKSWASTPNNMRKTSQKNTRRSLPLNKKNMNNSSQRDQGSDDSNATDVNAPKPDNEIVITPKSTLKPMPEIVKEKHSTAKKSVSRKVLIDHLTQSPDIAKELFKSPVKRKLSQSMRQYNSSKVFDDVQDANLLNAAHDASFNLLTKSKRQSKLFSDIDTSSSVIIEYESSKSLIYSPKNTESEYESLNLSRVSTRNSSHNIRGSTRSPKTPANTPNVSKNVSGSSKLKNTTPNSGSKKQNTLKSTKKGSAKAVKRLLKTPRVNKSPINDLTDVRGVKKLLQTPKQRKSPRNDLRDVSGVKRLMKSPRKSPKNDLTDVRGVKKILANNKSPKNDLRDVGGVKKLLKTPLRSNKSPKNDLTDVRGLRNILKTPRARKSPKNDLTDVRGLKNILKTPRVRKSPKNDLTDVRGVKEILLTPSRFYKSPNNDLTDVRGVKQLLRTPHTKKSPKNDLRDVKGIKKLLQTPRKSRSPKNDLRNVAGVKRLLKTPRIIPSPKNDLRNVAGVKRLLKTPSNKNANPKNDLSDVRGVKKLFSSPRFHSTKNDLSNVSGVQQLFSESNNSILNSTPEQKPQTSSARLTPKSENLFDSLVGKTPVRTYSNSKRNSSPTKSTIKTEHEDSSADRSRRQATIEQTNFSKEVSKVYFKKKEDIKTPDVSILGHSTPAVKPNISNIANNIKALSPILARSNNKSPVKIEKPKKTASKAKKQSPKARVTRNKNATENLNIAEIKPDVEVPKKTTRTRKNAADTADVKDIKVVAKKTVKSVRAQKKAPESKVPLDDSSKGIKKKVTFASDVKLKSTEDIPSTNKNNTTGYALAQVEENTEKLTSRSRRGSTVASSKASLSIEKVSKTKKAQAEESKAKPEKAKKVTKKTAAVKTVAVKSPKKTQKAAAKPVKEVAKKGTRAKKEANEPVVKSPAPKGRKRTATNAVSSTDKKKIKLDEKSTISSKASPAKSVSKAKKAKTESSPLAIRKTRSTTAKKK